MSNREVSAMSTAGALSASTFEVRTTPADGPGPDRLVGTVVSHYSVLSRLGVGAQGRVYLARDNRNNRQVALKFLLPQCCQDDLAVERFVREAKAGSAAAHPNICRVYGLESTSEGHLFIAMSYCEGRTLKQRLESGALRVEEAVAIAVQLADGLAAAHAHGVVHRDIKPGNLAMTADGIKILDFGLARLADSLQLTFESAPCGTAAYMSPEQSRGESADARSDVWSAGVVLYQMLSGEAPFKGSHTDAVVYSIRNDAPRPLRSRLRGVSSQLEDVVMRCLRKDVNGRFQSAADLARALRRVQLHASAVHPGWWARAMAFTHSRRWCSAIIPATQ